MLTTSEVQKLIRQRNQVRFFNPAAVAGLKAWYDATDIPSISIDTSDGVSQLNDKSGMGYHLTQGTAGNRPVLNYYGGPNGYAYLNFAGGSAKNLANANFVYAQPYTIFLVVRQNSIVHHSNVVQLATSTTGIAQSVTTPTNGNTRNTLGPVAAVNWANTEQIGTYNTSFALFKFEFNGSSSSMAMNDSNAQTGQTNPGTGGTTQMMIGASGTLPNFDFCELVFYNQILSFDDSRYITEGLMLKYGLQQADQYTFLGDSITVGSGSSDSTSTSFTALLCFERGKFFSNYAISGTCLYYKGGTVSNSNNCVGLLPKARVNPNSWVFLCYGTNDGPSSYGVIGNWQNVLQSQVDLLISWGVSPSKIILMTPPYNSTKTQLSSIQTATQTVAAARKVNLVDTYQNFINNSWDCGVSGNAVYSDGTHPNDTGHRNIANAIEALIN